MEQIAVSIIVPVYNTQAYLKKCVDSILSQTFQNFELILVDDGSTDNSPGICDRYQNRDSRVRVLHKENGGPCAARNLGLELAQGKYICFVDSDDYIEPVLLDKTVAVMEQQVDWCGFGMVKEDREGNFLDSVAFIPREYTVGNEESRMEFLLKNLLNYRTGWELWNHVFRGDIIRQHRLRFKGERVAFAEDLLFSFEYWQYANSCVILKDLLYHYVQHSHSLMWKSQFRNVLPEVHEMALNAHEAVRKAGHEKIREDFAILYHHFMEWHARPYAEQKGLEWVAGELAALGGNPYLPKDADAAKLCFQRLLSKYGKYSGFVTAAIVIRSSENIPEAAACIDNLRNQTLQKLDILLITPSNIQLEGLGIGARQCVCPDMQPDNIMKTAFTHAWGEYLYFADCAEPAVPHFLEIMSDVMKYNDCSTAIASSWTSVVDVNSSPARYQFRKYMKEHEIVRYKVLFRAELLESSGLAFMDDLQRYSTELILSGHIIFFELEK